MEIRPVTIELLRAGPRHNQLLSPLTRYLGVCGDAPAGTVTLPYEHAAFEDQLAELRYEVASGDPDRRRQVLERLGRELAEVLSEIPGLEGVFSEPRDALTHLRLVLSASELALLPFELAKVPARPGIVSRDWLALQTQTPVCITRRVRSVSFDRVRWPLTPRLLFVSGPDVPEGEHLATLHQALAPWTDEGSRGEWLTELCGATLPQVIDACSRTAYSHVHVLAHGSEEPDARAGTYGVALADGVVSGKRLAGALHSVLGGRIHRPAVVTLATCGSAEQPGDVRTPDASVAHALHESGIPLVVASQFPLSREGSGPFARIFYGGQLRGEHPLETLYTVRLRLHSEFAQDYHDWASLVVYEALPSDLDEQLEALRYVQAQRAQAHALDRIESQLSSAREADPEGWSPPPPQEVASLVRAVEREGERLPRSGAFATDSAGLRAASAKRLAEVAFRCAVAPGTPEARRAELLTESRRRLEEALLGYRKAAAAFLAQSEESVQRRASLHWLLTQELSLDRVLGSELDREAWTTARFSARVHGDHPEPAERGWAEATLAELALLRLDDSGLTEARREELAQEVVERVHRIVDLCGGTSEQVASTAEQLRRYVEWWSDPRFGAAVEAGDLSRLVSTARRALEVLGGRPRKRRQPRAGRGPQQPRRGETVT